MGGHEVGGALGGRGTRREGHEVGVASWLGGLGGGPTRY